MITDTFSNEAEQGVLEKNVNKQSAPIHTPGYCAPTQFHIKGTQTKCTHSHTWILRTHNSCTPAPTLAHTSTLHTHTHLDPFQRLLCMAVARNKGQLLLRVLQLLLHLLQLLLHVLQAAITPGGTQPALTCSAPLQAQHVRIRLPYRHEPCVTKPLRKHSTCESDSPTDMSLA